MNISKGTIIRLIMTLLVFINLGLKASGHAVIDVSDSTVATFVEYAIEIAALCVAVWKNNSVTPAAIRADEFLKELREGNKGEE